jgi:hypothetical protein
MEASLRSPFTSLVVCASGSSGENPSFDLGRSRRRRRHRRFPLGGVAFGGPVFRLLFLARVRGPGAGVEVGVAAPDFFFASLVSTLVAWVTRSSASQGRGLGTGVCVVEVWMSERRL